MDIFTIVLLLAASAGGRTISFERVTGNERAQFIQSARAMRGATPGVALETHGARTAVIASLGEKPTGGYGIHIERVSLQGNMLAVHARVTEPAKGSIVTQALTYPIDVV